jgi:hypothetical protein
MESVLDIKGYSNNHKDIEEDSERKQAEIKLMSELAIGRKAGEIQGWETIEVVEAALGIK